MEERKNIVCHVFDKSAIESIKFLISQKGKDRKLHVRTYYKDLVNRKDYPTKKGITVDQSEIGELEKGIKAIRQLLPKQKDEE